MPFSLYVAYRRSCDTEPELHGGHLQLLHFIGLRGSGTTLNIELEPLMESGGSSPIVNLHGIERFLDYVEHRT